MQILVTKVSATENGLPSISVPLEVIGADSATPTGLPPATIKSVYNLPSTGGQGTIAIIDAFDDPTILNDTNVFSKQYGLPNLTSTNFEEHKMGSVPFNDGWAVEISLDVQWTHAIAPNAKILLVETPLSWAGLFDGIDYARSRTDVIAISMSWGSSPGELSNETSYDPHLQPLGNASCCFFAAAGDQCENVSYPACSPNVVGVGGTTLNFNPDGSFASETAWPSTGGGVSQFETEPSYQVSYGVQGSNGHRGVPDVSFDAGTAVSIYDSNGGLLWLSVTGTSIGAPAWAAIHSIRLTASNDRLYPVAKSTFYHSCFRDITSGNNGLYSATAGYDFCTGLGSPLTTVFNRPPNTPSTPSGPTSGHGGTTYSYSTSTTDPDNDSVRYVFNWGDGSTNTTGWYASGVTATASHSWSSPGTYRVKVQAQDSTGALSDWSPYLTVSISGHVEFLVYENGTENGVNGIQVEAWNTESKEFYIDYTEGGGVGQGAHAEFWLEEGNYTFTFTDPSYGYHSKAFTREVTSDTVETVYLVPGFQNITITGGAVALPYGAEAVYPGWGAPGKGPVVVNVTVENQEATTQNTTVTVYAKGVNDNGENYKTLIGEENVTNLPSGHNKTISFNWDTTGVAPSNYIYRPLPRHYTPYNITAVAGDYTDKFCGANVTVRIPGDAYSDGHCAVGDLALLGASWYKCYPNVGYNWRADFNGGGCVEVGDLAILGGNWYRYSEADPEGGNTTKVYVNPQTATAAIGDTFTINITVSNVSNLYSWSAGIDFNASVLECLSFEEGPFLEQGGDTVSVSGTIDNENGTIYPPYGYSLTESGGVNGTGVLASVTFKVIGLGDSYINLTNVDLIKMVEGDPEKIPFEAVNGHFEKWHDIAITNVTFSYDTTVVYPTWQNPPKINVTVKNEGVSSETFNVTAYYENATGTYTIETQNVTNLAPGANTTLTFTWDVPPLPGYPGNSSAAWPYPSYIIFANASVVPQEVDTSDNSYIYGTVKVQWPGDANGDGHVNGTDYSIIIDSWYKEYGDPDYDPRADFNGNGGVTIHDLVIYVRNVGKGPLD